MLLSLVISLAPLQPASLPAHLGRATRSLFLDMLRDIDPELAGELISGGEQRPYTVSDLRGRPPGEQRQGIVHPERRLWMRVTSFDSRDTRLSTALLGLKDLINSSSPQIELVEQPFHLQAATLDPKEHPWAGQSSYDEMAQTILLASRQPPTFLELEFSSPTTFRVKGDKLQPFPLPDLVLGNWLDKWNLFAPVTLPLEARPFALESLAASRYRLETQAVNYWGAPFIGFTGRCAYRLLERDPYWLRLVHTLAAFSFYCGSGYKTSFGFGQTRIWKK